MSSAAKAHKAKRQVVEMLRQQPGIRGVGLGWTAEGELCVRVNVAPEELAKVHLPSEINGVPIMIEPVGKIELHRRAASG